MPEILNLTAIDFKTANGLTTNLNTYAGQVVLIVNVASKCGFTPQYEGLESLYEKYQSAGFTILGFPANEFGAQEPGSTSEIQEFCRLNFGVKFPVLEKVVVRGSGQHPLFQSLTRMSPPTRQKSGSQLQASLTKHGLWNGSESDIKWNFEKFLIGRDGSVVARFASDVAPEDPELIRAIEKELGT